MVFPRARLRVARVASWCLAFGSLVAFAAPRQITSNWRTHDIQIDGLNAEWPALDELDKGPAVAVANDDEFAYVVVSTSDAQMRQQIAPGIILWFDPTNGQKETFAIGIPGSILPPGPSSRRGGDSLTDAPPQGSPGSSPGEPIDQFDVYGPGKSERHLVRMNPSYGIEMATATTQGTVGYELKLPLVKTDAHPYAVGARPGATVGFAIATPETPTLPSAGRTGGGGTGGGFGGMGRGGGMGGGGMGGGMGGGGGYGGMGRGGRTGGGGRDEAVASRPKPIKIWTTLKLAAPPTPAR